MYSECIMMEGCKTHINHLILLIYLIMLSLFKVIIDETAEEKRNLESEVKTLHEKVTQLETEISDATKQLTLLSEFPILGHMGGTDAAQYLEDELLQKSVFSLGDEMAKQVKANNIRIAVLEEQNNSLRTALARYEHRSENIPSQIVRIIYIYVFIVFIF